MSGAPLSFFKILCHTVTAVLNQRSINNLIRDSKICPLSHNVIQSERRKEAYKVSVAK